MAENQGETTPQTHPNPPSNTPGTGSENPSNTPESAIVLSFWQKPFVQNVLPLITSILLHAAIITLGLLTVKVVEAVTQNQVREQIIIPDAEMVGDGPEGGIPHPGLGGDPTRDAAQNLVPDVPPDSKGLAEKAGTNLMPEMMNAGGGGADGDAAAVIGIGPGTFGKGPGAGFGSGEGNSGQLAPFGVPGGGGGVGPKSSFFGLGGAARKIVYVVDASGDMIDVFDDVRGQLKKSIEKLQPSQAFNILFFRDDGIQKLEGALTMAIPANKAKAYKFIDTAFCRGSTVPLPAVQMAFGQRPELIYCFTNGFRDAASPEAIEKEFKSLNPGNRVKVNMVVLYGGKLEDVLRHDKPLFDMVERVTQASGGKMRLMSVEDVRRE